jgi:hypothetical protein
MSTLRANTLKPITSGNSLVLQGDSGGSGVSGPSIDSNGDVDFSQNTNAKVKLPSGGGIYESDGSTEILTESSGAVTLKNTTLENTVVGGAMSVGTVSESSGTPTGDIIQRGSNSNGEYVRYADGTQICVIEDATPSTSADVTWTFPVAFASGTVPTPAGVGSTSIDRVATGGVTAVSNTAWVFRLWNLGDNSRSGLDANLSAIGRWF